jgi:signal transduction histidine kinase
MNAADAMKETNNGSTRIAVTSERDDKARQLRLRVSDTGPGITASNLARVFEPHFTTKATGHGFGLSTSYRIVTNHGGKIAAESPAGQGATFTVTLPLPGTGSWT